MHSPPHLPGRITSFLKGHKNEPKCMSDGAFLSCRREDCVTEEVAYARNYCINEWNPRKEKWYSVDMIKCKFPGGEAGWKWEEACSHHDLEHPCATSDDLDLAPEEIVERGEIYEAETYTLEHPVYPVVLSSSPPKWNRFKGHIKSIGHRHTSIGSDTTSDGGAGRVAQGSNWPGKMSPTRSDSGYSS